MDLSQPLVTHRVTGCLDKTDTAVRVQLKAVEPMDIVLFVFPLSTNFQE